MNRTVNKQIERPQLSGALPSAIVRKSRLSWALWLIPVGAVAVCGWFFYRDYVATGPLITIYFQDAEGLEAGNTQVVYRGATVGAVKSVDLSTDDKSVRITARLASSAAQLARVGSVFWIVRPQVRIGAISGLRTIVSGEYISVQPGAGDRTNSFAGADRQPISIEPGSLPITLMVSDLGALQEQTPIFYRGVQAGEITYYQLSPDSHQVLVHARIAQEYAPLVRMDTEFWNAGGLDMHFGLFKGVQVSAESPKTLLSGGIEFATPTEYLGPATNGEVFILHEKADDKWKTWRPTIDLDLPVQAVHSNTPAASFLK